MSSLVVAGSTLVCSVAGIALGAWVRRRLPDHEVRDEAKDVLKTATGMIATLVALVIGLLVSSSKSAFDQASSGVTQMGARIIMLDSLLARYGPDTADARSLLKTSVAAAIERLGAAKGAHSIDPATIGASATMEAAYDRIRSLSPADESHRFLQAQALQLCGDLLQSRWLLIEGTQAGLPTVFLSGLIFWPTVLFAGLGLQAPGGVEARSSLVVCALSMAGAVFLILEMNRPLEGTIRISPGPLIKARSLLGT